MVYLQRNVSQYSYKKITSSLFYIYFNSNNSYIFISTLIFYIIHPISKTLNGEYCTYNILSKKYLYQSVAHMETVYKIFTQ